MTGVVFRESSMEITLYDRVCPLGPTVLDLAPYLVSDLDGYTVQQLGEVPTSMILRDAGREMALYVGMPGFAGIVEQLGSYTVLDLASYTVAQLDDL